MVKIETVSSSETVATMYQSARCHNPEEHMNLQYCKNFKTHTYHALLSYNMDVCVKDSFIINF
jgi:hypothetical protein